MVLFNPYPFAFFFDYGLFDLVIRCCLFSLYEITYINLICKDSPYHDWSPLRLFFCLKACLIIASCACFILSRWKYSWWIKFTCNCILTFSMQLHSENIFHNICCIYINFQFVLIFIILFVSIWHKCRDYISLLSLNFKMWTYLNWNITTVSIINKIFEWNNNLIWLRLCLSGINTIIDCNKSYSHSRE